MRKMQNSYLHTVENRLEYIHNQVRNYEYEKRKRKNVLRKCCLHRTRRVGDVYWSNSCF